MRFLIVFVPLLLLLAACAAPQPAAEDAAANVEQVKAASQAPAGVDCTEGKEPWRAQRQPKRGGILIMATTGFADALETATARMQIQNSLLQGRFCFPLDGAVVPSLAKSWEISPDGLIWTLKLREDVKWHNKPPMNGRPLTSADVAWTAEWQLKAGNERVWWEPVTVSAPDAHTVVLRLKEIDADFLGKLAAGTNVIRPKEVWEQSGDFKTGTSGTGAFMVKSYTPDQVLVLEANPAYYEKGSDGKPLPYVDEVRVTAFADPAAEFAALRSGQADHTSVFGVRKLDADALQQSGVKFTQWVLLQPTHTALWFDAKKKPWDDVRVRRAAALAIDREALLIANRGGSAHSAFLPLTQSEYAWPEAKMKEKFRHDPETAKKLLAEAGYVNLSGLEILTTQEWAQDAEVAQNGLAAVGINAQLKLSAQRTSTAVIRDGARQGQFDLAFGNLGGPQVDFAGWWMGDLIRTGSSWHVTRFSDPALDTLGAAQQKELDPVKRKQIMDQIQDKLYDLMPYVPGTARVYYHFINCRVKNFKQVHMGRNTQGPMYAWIDQAGC